MSDTADAFAVDVEGGRLVVHDLSGGPVRHGAPVVLAAHGITANGLMWQPVADELVRRRGPGAVRFLAPDLRGRGASNGVKGPFGLAAHAHDLLAVATEVGDCPVLVGHAMGAFVAALTITSATGSFRGAVLVDGGFPSLEGRGADAVRASILHDLVGAGDGQWRSACVLEAVRADGADVLADEGTHRAVADAVVHGVPVELIWARRGLLDEPQGLYDEQGLAALEVPPEVRVTAVDANHYTVVLEQKGVAAVADAIERQLDVVR